MKNTNFDEKIQKLKTLLQLQAPCVKIQKP